MKNSSIKIRLIIEIILILTLILVAIPTCFGYGIPDTYAPSNEAFHDKITFENSAAGDTTPANIILQIIAGALLYFAAPLTIATIVFSGITMITGGANSEQQEQGKKQLQWALLGLLAVILSYSIVRIAITFMLNAAEQPAPPGT